MKNFINISKNVVVIFIMILILSVQFLINITMHTHVLPSGQIISHSHVLPFNRENSKDKSHSHTEDELKFYSINSFVLKFFLQPQCEHIFSTEKKSLVILFNESIIYTNLSNLPLLRAPPIISFI